MKTLVAYDIASDRRRHRVSQLLLLYGERIQYSVFECDLPPPRLAELQSRLAPLLRPSRDRVHFYPLCQSCVAKASSMGAPYPSSTNF